MERYRPNSLKLVYYGTVYSKKNSKRIIRNRYTGKMALIPSESAQENERDMASQFRSQPFPDQIQYPCKIDIVIYEPNYTRRDLDNQATSILDALKISEIIEDDDYKHIDSMSVRYGGVDKKNPRAEIVIQEKSEVRDGKD